MSGITFERMFHVLILETCYKVQKTSISYPTIRKSQRLIQGEKVMFARTFKSLVLLCARRECIQQLCWHTYQASSRRAIIPPGFWKFIGNSEYWQKGNPWMKLKISLMPFQFQKEMVSIWLLTQKSKTNISSKTVRKESVWHQK